MPIAKIESLDNNARGICHNEDGKTIFIDDALPNEIVEYAKFKDKKKYELAHLIKVIKPAAARVEPKCKYFGICGGCAMQHIEMTSQVAVKQRVLEDNLWHIGKVKAQTMLPPIVGSAWNYRHKARLSVRNVPKKGGVLIGFHERKSSYIADMQTCEILPKAISDLLMPLRSLIASLTLAEKIPQIEISVGEFVIALVLRILEPLSDNDKTLLKIFADNYNENNSNANANANAKQKLAFYLQEKGPDSVYLFYPQNENQKTLSYLLPEFNLEMQFQPTDFTQVNHQINKVMIRQALSFLQANQNDIIADFFCGLGNFTLPIAKQKARVFGVEGNAELVKRANDDAKNNNLQDLAKFKVANLFKFDLPELEKLIAENDGKIFNKWLIDPPREGAVELIKALPDEFSEIKPKLIVYVSCNPATLARDAGILVHLKNYELRFAGIINMFPHTAHVESMAVFALKE